MHLFHLYIHSSAAFGATSQASTPFGGLNKPAGGGLFGSTAPTTGGLFGQTSSAGTAFGSTPATGQTGGLFGSSASKVSFSFTLLISLFRHVASILLEYTNFFLIFKICIVHVGYIFVRVEFNSIDPKILNVFFCYRVVSNECFKKTLLKGYIFQFAYLSTGD